MDRKWISPVTLEGVEFHYKDFAGNRYGKENRGIGIRLSKDLADSLNADGWDVHVLEATEQYPEEKYYLPIKIKYGFDRNGKYRHPDIYMICGDKMTLLDENTVDELDRAEIDNVDLTFSPNFHERGISAYLQKMYVTIHQDHLSLKYSRFNNPAPAMDDEEIPF